ncbi:MAG: response regulator transcription factor [Alcaligenaceae bacterium]|nr:response regulator transcription factor [Alcaligenaceae bacterium]
MRILLVEDELTLAEQLKSTLSTAAYVVSHADNGRDAWFLGDVEAFDAVILDLGLPEMDGISVLKKWREAGHKMPVLILTARDNWYEKVTGIDAGADDYLTKPFHSEELLARLRALLRRSAGHASAMLACGRLTLDTRNTRLMLDGHPLTLTSHEYMVIAFLMHHQGEVISRTTLMEHIYEHDSERDSNTIDVFVARLRKKLPVDTIETVRGLGYRLTVQA